VSGTVAVRLAEALLPRKRKIGEAALSAVRDFKTVLLQTTPISGS